MSQQVWHRPRFAMLTTPRRNPNGRMISEPNVVTRSRAKQLRQASRHLSPFSMPVNHNLAHHDQPAPPNVTNHDQSEQHEPASSRVAIDKPQDKEPNGDSHKAAPNVTSSRLELPSALSRRPDNQNHLNEPFENMLTSLPKSAKRDDILLPSEHASPATELPVDRPSLASNTVEDYKKRKPNVVTRRQARDFRKAFHLFPRLPLELRCKIWDEAIPSYGLYPVSCVLETHRSETPPAPGRRCVIFRLRPLLRHRWDPSFSERVCTMHNLLATCRESRKEVTFRFPDTVSFGGSTFDSYRGGMLRFNGKKDVVSITSELGFDDHFLERTGLCHLFFVNNWNIMVHKLAVRNVMLEVMMGGLFPTASPTLRIGRYHKRYARRLTRMLHRMPNLKQFFLHDVGKISVSDWNKTPADTRRYLQGILSQCCWTEMGVHTTRLEQLAQGGRPRKLDIKRLDGMGKAASALERVVRGDPDDEANRPFSQQIQIGYTELQGVEIVQMYHLEPQLGHLCRNLSFS